MRIRSVPKRRRHPDGTQQSLRDDLSPDVILPSQFFSPRRQVALRTAEHTLLLALLNDAIQCFCKYLHARNSRERRLFRDADAWIMGGGEPPANHDDQLLGFDFESVCEFLGIDAGYLRDGLRRWRDRNLRVRMTA